MRACLQCVGLLYLFCNNHTGHSCFDNNHRGREHGGPFGDLLLYPLLAASLEIYSIYVRNETANNKKKKKKKKIFFFNPAGRWYLDSVP